MKTKRLLKPKPVHFLEQISSRSQWTIELLSKSFSELFSGTWSVVCLMSDHVSPNCIPAISIFESIFNIFVSVALSSFTGSWKHWLQETCGEQLVQPPAQGADDTNTRPSQTCLCLVQLQKPSRTVAVQPLLPHQPLPNLHYHCPVWISHPLASSAPCLSFLVQLRRVCLCNLCNYPSSGCSLLLCLPLSSPSLNKRPFPKFFCSGKKIQMFLSSWNHAAPWIWRVWVRVQVAWDGGIHCLSWP